jgi:hypothetical protein
MRKALLRILVAAGALLLAGGTAARAAEASWCTFYITNLPYTASVQGQYCFDRNLSTNMTTGAAITINSDFVLLDLNNFKLGGGGAGPATDAIGVYASDRSNLTVRNGNIRGFGIGIMIEGSTGSTAQNILIENNALDGNLKVGVSVFGKSATIRNNTISNTGGTTSNKIFCSGNSIGITNVDTNCSAFSAGNIEVVNNTIRNVFSPGWGPFTLNWGVRLGGSGNIAYLNRIMQVSGNQSAIANDLGVCRDNTAIDINGQGYDCTFLVGVNSDN